MTDYGHSAELRVVQPAIWSIKWHEAKPYRPTVPPHESRGAGFIARVP